MIYGILTGPSSCHTRICTLLQSLPAITGHFTSELLRVRGEAAKAGVTDLGAAADKYIESVLPESVGKQPGVDEWQVRNWDSSPAKYPVFATL